jgi:hypothetical protein
MQLQEGMTEGGFFTAGDCTNNGTCALSLELEAQPTNTFCPNDNWLFRFTPDTFKALTEFCPGGTADGLCCASTDRQNGSCGSGNVFTNSENVFGAPSRNLLLCELTDGPPVLGENTLYDCDNVLVP